eukprot:scaffold28206_cov43-Phaeocystis_antarctica.AAC.1
MSGMRTTISSSWAAISTRRLSSPGSSTASSPPRACHRSNPNPIPIPTPNAIPNPNQVCHRSSPPSHSACGQGSTMSYSHGGAARRGRRRLTLTLTLTPTPTPTPNQERAEEGVRRDKG